ncbi:MAG TPA: hypothetical protein VN673_17560 [Clostridia bacterium]|nr:hypothetical protein [Clostridia bacterium]
MNRENEKITTGGTLVCTIGGKGGCGKTTFIAHLIALLLLLSIKLRIYDFEEGDSQSGLKRYFPEAEKLPLHLKQNQERHSYLNRLINDFETSPGGLSIVDLPANSGDVFLQWAKGVPWKTLQAHGIRVVMIANATDDSDTLRLALRWIRELQEKVTFVAVENQGLGSTFAAWRKSKQGVEFDATCKPVRVSFPKIPADWFAILENAGKTIFSPQEQLAKLLQLHWMEQGQLELLQNDVRIGMDPVIKLLIESYGDQH